MDESGALIPPEPGLKGGRSPISASKTPPQGASVKHLASFQRNLKRIPRFFHPERRERRSRPSGGQLWETQESHQEFSNSDSWAGSRASRSRGRNSKRMPRFFHSRRRERRSRPSGGQLWGTQDSISTSQTPTFWAERHALRSLGRNSRRMPRFFHPNGESSALTLRGQLWETQDSILASQTPTFGPRDTLFDPGVEIEGVFQCFLDVERREQRSRPSSATLGDAGFHPRSSNRKFLDRKGETLEN